MFVFTPVYTSVLFQQALGIVILLLEVLFTAGGYFVSGLAIELFKRRRTGLGVLLAIGSLVLCTFPALWLVLLGPAALILMRPAT